MRTPSLIALTSLLLAGCANLGPGQDNHRDGVTSLQLTPELLDSDSGWFLVEISPGDHAFSIDSDATFVFQAEPNPPFARRHGCMTTNILGEGTQTPVVSQHMFAEQAVPASGAGAEFYVSAPGSWSMGDLIVGVLPKGPTNLLFGMADRNAWTDAQAGALYEADKPFSWRVTQQGRLWCAGGLEEYEGGSLETVA